MQATTPIWVIADPALVREIGIKEFSSFVNHRKVSEMNEKLLKN
jgi:hypothetical protein